MLAPALPAAAQVAQAAQPGIGVMASAAARPAPLTEFAPRPSKRTRLDYGIWNDALQNVVIYGGPSLRERARRPKSDIGSRIVYGHTSPFRLEGNKVAFEFMGRELDGVLRDYIEDLERIANDIDIPSLQRNEQLAFWLNLHNAMVLEGLNQAYPVSVPETYREEDGSLFHDFKRIEIDGVKLSLRDIRERIVYPNWKDSRVIYGFFHGDLGSPIIQTRAFRSDNVWILLGQSAGEFVNSLRGLDDTKKALRVSRLYEDVAPWYFPDFEADLRAHLADKVLDETLEDIGSLERPIEVAKYETVIADLTAGDGNRQPASNVESVAGINGRAKPFGPLGRSIIERREKFQDMRERGMTGTVIITDIVTEDEQNVEREE